MKFDHRVLKSGRGSRLILRLLPGLSFDVSGGLATILPVLLYGEIPGSELGRFLGVRRTDTLELEWSCS